METRGRKDAADKALISDMCLLAVEHAPPVGVVLMSGDADFAYALARLRGFGYFTVVVANGNGVKCGKLLREVPNVLWGLRKHVLAVELNERNSGIGRPRRQRKGDENEAVAEGEAEKVQSCEIPGGPVESQFEVVGEGQKEGISAGRRFETLRRGRQRVRAEDRERMQQGRRFRQVRAVSSREANADVLDVEQEGELRAVDQLRVRISLRNTVLVVVIGLSFSLISTLTNLIFNQLECRTHT